MDVLPMKVLGKTTLVVRACWSGDVPNTLSCLGRGSIVLFYATACVAIGLPTQKTKMAQLLKLNYIFF